MDSNIIEWLNLVVRWIHVIKGIFSRPNGIWRRVDGFDFLQLIPFLDTLFPAYLFCPIIEIDSFRGEWADRLVPPFQHAI